MRSTGIWIHRRLATSNLTQCMEVQRAGYGAAIKRIDSIETGALTRCDRAEIGVLPKPGSKRVAYIGQPIEEGRRCGCRCGFRLKRHIGKLWLTLF